MFIFNFFLSSASLSLSLAVWWWHFLVFSLAHPLVHDAGEFLEHINSLYDELFTFFLTLMMTIAVLKVGSTCSETHFLADSYL